MTAPVWLLLAGLFGLIIGSFCNVVIHRLPRIMDAEWEEELRQAAGPDTTVTATPPRLSLSQPRSHCPHCRTPLRLIDLVPVLSWLALRGRCHHCQAGISPRYPLVELASAGLAVLSVWQLGPGAEALACYGLLVTLLTAALVDQASQWLPDRITLPLLWTGLLVTSLGLNPAGTDLGDAVWGAAAGYLSLWLVAGGFRLITGRDGLGGGDSKLLAALGAWLGWMPLPSVLLLSSLTGLVIALWLRWRHGHRGSFAFGPAIALAGALLFWQQVGNPPLPY